MKKLKEFKSFQLSAKEKLTVKGGETILAEGIDSGGHYYVIDDGSSCVKVYRECEFPPIF